MFNVTETFVLGKRQEQSLCEDRIVQAPAYAAIIDGVTSSSVFPGEVKKKGLIAGEVIASAIEKAPPEMDCFSFFELLNDALYRRQQPYLELLQNSPEKRLAASIIVYSDFRHEIWAYGDCQCLVNGRLHEYPNRIDEISTQARCEYLEIELKRGKTEMELLSDDTGRQLINPLLEGESVFINCRDSEYGYAVLNGFGIWREKLSIISVKTGDTVVLASDGYPKLFSSLKQSEEYLEYIRANDPLCMKIYKSVKGFTPGNNSYDDRSYIRFTVL